MYIINTYICISAFIVVCLSCKSGSRHADRYYCEYYYECIEDEYKLQVCDNGNIFNDYECVTHDKYKQKYGTDCVRCPSFINAMIHNSIACSRISHNKCCYEIEDIIVYCATRGVWAIIEKNITNCDHLLKML
ncbi:unknown similar to AMEVITR04 [Mythimna separata entomopoxvirus 'L']|uniref:Uncharacterized protein n=1 Tax=Mythimna separata entomopoxvirus 'L' TaxID=1293572 RepID=A0A916P1B6_9POXV|nr:unknown similar to AMEVITR04 [Mythimna separata entomopoxvirus 'L']CCU56232.1 unknown similar to AMEVITR04 [Mythimna separata entomopoxvirus 'L']